MNIFKIKDNPILGILIGLAGILIFFFSGTITEASGWDTGNVIGAVITVAGVMLALINIGPRIGK